MLIKLLILIAIFFAAKSAGELVEGEEPKNIINLGQQTYFQGDILAKPKTRNGIIAAGSRWPNGVVPYRYGTNFPAQYSNMLRAAMQSIERNTCIRFKQHTNEQDYIIIYNTTGGCYSTSVGRAGGQQHISLMDTYQGSCWTNGIIVHEFLHAIGLWHEQMRYDRDNYLNIVWQNIGNGMQSQFQIVSNQQSSTYNLPYDYTSVMHYDAYAFGNGRMTMQPRDQSYTNIIGKAKDGNENDWEKVRRIYKCPASGTGTGPSPGPKPKPTPGPGPKPSEDCKDDIDYCTDYKSDCQTQGWLKRACRVTCGFCTPISDDSNGSDNSDNDTSGGDDNSGCRDKLAYCNQFTATSCQRADVKQYCPKTCDAC